MEIDRCLKNGIQPTHPPEDTTPDAGGLSETKPTPKPRSFHPEVGVPPQPAGEPLQPAGVWVPPQPAGVWVPPQPAGVGVPPQPAGVPPEGAGVGVPPVVGEPLSRY